ncbi:DUF2987 domain-containing protein [Vibrio rumoiensis]|uniref:DUF2987 domain-containing protein n=1 Tax=Vibrio rumoiensis 1S-45 TaxID=1188252 RepID=A0A1E5E6P2_9VIBR|nr:DUF2987 domain-containing protein [Vibrio rumoiensis]OEF30196.1 hypothetical protein A1QC_00430 [Vibrio rumoiensis 1S-45]
MRKATLTACALMASLLSVSANAEQYRFNYSKLYTQMKNNLEEGHPDVKVAFFFQENQSSNICHIEKAWMEKEEHYEEFSIPSSQELIVPIDSNLRKAAPLVYVDTEKGKLCDFSMVVMTKEPLQGKVSYDQIEALIPQMSKMLNDLGGMFSSWFAPDVIGLTLEFNDIQHGSISVSDGSIINIENGKAVVKLADLKKGNTLTLPQATFRVLPLLEK